MMFDTQSPARDCKLKGETQFKSSVKKKKKSKKSLLVTLHFLLEEVWKNEVE